MQSVIDEYYTGLKALDIEFMKKLHDKVNIIPVLSKADTMTPEECSHFKKQVGYIMLQRKLCNAALIFFKGYESNKTTPNKSI